MGSPTSYSVLVAASLVSAGVVIALLGLSPGPPGGERPSGHIAVPDLKKVMVMRVYFNDYAADSRYTQAEVQGFFDTNLHQLFMDTSYGNIGIDAQVTDLYQLPEDRDQYITDHGDGDLSEGDQFDNVLEDAIDASPAGLDWTDLDAIMVLMAETDAAQFHRGQQANRNLPQGPGGDVESTPAAVFSENPGDSDVAVWGRWAHEIGHAFQEGGPAHPSNYNNEFELMDSNYPGQTGVFEKQDGVAFPGWLFASKYLEFDPASGGGIANIWAEEYDPSGMPNVQAVRAFITDDLYYLVSVRRKVLGDDLNACCAGIPDEGVLIERVSVGGDPWVTVKGKGGDRNDLWDANDTYTDAGDGITIGIVQKIDDDNYQVYVRYDNGANQPDVSMEPWRSPPGNAYETTDIWIDSPVNGYGTYRYGSWLDLSGNPVPAGNGDPPAVGLVNRVYARVRNVGTTPATDVHANFEVTDPLGVGINGANGFIPLGTVDSGDFAALAAVAPGAFEDVYVEWTPAVEDVPEEALEDGLFRFHSCLRVILDPVAGETVFGNQDGDEEQENVDYFEDVPPEEGGSGEPFMESITLRNDDTGNAKFFYLTYRSDLPPGWGLDINGGDLALELGPDEAVDVPITIAPVGPSPPLGSAFRVEVFASSFRELENDLDPTDKHLEFEALGGVTVETRVMRHVDIDLSQVDSTPTGISVEGMLLTRDYASFFDASNPFRVLVIGARADGSFVPGSQVLLVADAAGMFQGVLPPNPEVVQIIVLFAGSDRLAGASTGFVPLGVGAGLRITPRTLNLKSQGKWITARISFEEDVSSLVDLGSLSLEGVAPDRVQMLGSRDLLAKFSREALIVVLSPGPDQELCVTGRLTDGRAFEACDMIRVILP